jgi:signal transduction histidine kinase
MALSELTPAALPQSLRHRRERAERIMNALRAGILLLLAIAALAYSPALDPALDRVNMLLLAPALAWTVGQYILWYRKPQLPRWLPVKNAVFDVTAVTGIIAGYSIAGSGNLALRAPIFLMYFVILAARPVASSARITATVAALAVAEYTSLLIWLLVTNRITPVMNPMTAVQLGHVSYLDEGAKILILAIAGSLATYATRWVEGLVIESARESDERHRVATRLVQAQLDTLRLQLSPHFLFNALNSAMALIATNARAAEKMLASISDFLRMILNSSKQPTATVEHELSLIRHYVEIQRARFGDKLNVTYSVDESLEPALVPSLLLQPLVENSIRHGIGPRSRGGMICISIHSREKTLLIDIEDNGVGPTAKKRDREKGTGLGLSNTATRLNHLYGERHIFETGPGSDGGFRVHIEIPLETMPHVTDRARREIAGVTP